MTDIYIYMMIGDTDSQVIMWLYYSLMVNTFVIYHQFHSSSWKYLTIAYINENSASVADKFAQFVATTFKQIEVITHESLIEKMQMLVAKTERNHSDCSQFYYTLYALRKLDRSGFFESKDDSNELEDLLLEVPRPRNNNWARY